MMNVVQRLGKSRIYEYLEQLIGALDYQNEQNQALIGQLKDRAEKAEKEVAELTTKLEGEISERLTAKKQQAVSAAVSVPF